MSRTPPIAVVHTRASRCRCHASFLRALGRLGLPARLIAAEEIARHRGDFARAPLTFEHADTYLGRGDLQPLVRLQIEAWGGRVAGSPSAAALLADDKAATVERLRAVGVPVPRSKLVANEADCRGLSPPWVLKRPFEHGSRGIALAANAAAARRQLARWRRQGEVAVLAQEYVGGQELAVSVLETRRGPRALPIVAVSLAEPTYSARTKWGAAPLPIAPAKLHRGLLRRIETGALKAFAALGMRDYARFDLRLDGCGAPCFLEANARPSVEDGTELVLSCELAGMSFEVFLLHVILNAARRHRLTSLATLAAARLRKERP